MRKIFGSMIALLLTQALLMSFAVSANARAFNIVLHGTSEIDRYIVAVSDRESQRKFQTRADVTPLYGNFLLVQSDLPALLETLKSLDGTNRVNVYPDRLFKAHSSPNDPLFTRQWNMRSGYSYGVEIIGAHMQFKDTQPGEGSVVAVIDTGYVSHPDLEGSYIGGFDFIDDVRNSNDGDGRDSDPRDPGDWSGPYPSSWHGTHVHGIIAATQNNNIGIVGVAPYADVLHARVLGTLGGYESDIATAIRWSAGLPVAGIPTNQNPADVINLSLGRFGECGVLLQSAIDDAVNAGSVVVVAAGNDGTLANFYAPANCKNSITVAATGPQGLRASYSNYGLIVEVAAPGGDFATTLGTAGGILSTVDSGAQGPAMSGYRNYQGTSMAAPHVAGIVALAKSANPYLSAQQLVEIITTSTSPFARNGDVNSCSWYDRCGRGIANARKAVAKALTTEGENNLSAIYASDPERAVVNLSHSYEASNVTLKWNPPSNATGLTGYTVNVSGKGTVCSIVGVATTCQVSGLASGQDYVADVVANFGMYKGPTSTLTFTMYFGPLAPVIKSVKSAKRTLTVTWSASDPRSPMPILRYRVEGLRRDGSVAALCESTSLTCALTFLKSGESLRVKVTAFNAIGSASVVSRQSYKPK